MTDTDSKYSSACWNLKSFAIKMLSQDNIELIKLLDINKQFILDTGFDNLLNINTFDKFPKMVLSLNVDFIFK